MRAGRRGRRTWALLTGAIAGFLLVGCVSVPTRPSFDAVRADVAERSGDEIEWSGVSADPRELEAVRAGLLAGELEADGAVRVALLGNQRLQAAYTRLGRVSADYAQAALPPNPVLEAVAGFHGGDVEILEFSLVSELLDALFVPVRRAMAADELAAARLEIAGEVLDVASETRRSFYAHQADLAALEIERRILLAAEASHEMSERLYEAGNISRLDLLREKDLLESVKLAVASAEMRVLDGRERLNRLMGLWGAGAGSWRASGALPALPAEEPELDDVERQAVLRSLELALANARIEAAARRLGITRVTARIPEVEAGAFAEREHEGPGSNQEHEWAVGPVIALPLPIFDRGGPARARAQAELEGLWSRYTATAIDLRSRARQAAVTVRWARQRAEHARDVLLPLRREITQETQLHYNAMFLGVFELLDAKRRELEGERLAVTALADYWNAKAALGQILAGRLGPGTAPGGMTATAAPSAGRDEEGGH